MAYGLGPDRAQGPILRPSASPSLSPGEAFSLKPQALSPFHTISPSASAGCATDARYSTSGSSSVHTVSSAILS